MTYFKDWLLMAKVQSDNAYASLMPVAEFRKGRKMLILGLFVLMAQTCFAQVVTDVGSNPFIKGAVAVAQLLVYGLGGVLMIFGIFILAKSWLSAEQMNRGKGWLSLAGGAIVMGAFPIAKWVNAWWQANETGVGDIYLGE